MSDGSLEERYLYNKDGSLLAAINSSGIETFEYTFNGYIKNKSRNGRNILSYEYNKNGSVEAVVDQTGARTEYIYDTIGRMQTVKDGTQEIASYNYNIDNTISAINYNTGINISYQYDRDKNIENLISKDPQNNIIKELEYSYYNNGNVKTKIENGNTTAYTYDKADRLKIENNPTAGLIVYSYDNAHNMLSKKVGENETTYSYDVNNRLIQSTNNSVVTDYTYDNNGNLLREEKGTEYTNYIYDGFNKLKEINKSNGSWMYNEYSALGLRIATEENGVRAEFTFDRGSIITEVDSNNELIARSIRGLGLVAQKDNRNVLSYYLHNAHGDVTNLVDGNGQVLNSYEYDAFGNTLNHAEKVANRIMYAGEQFDKVTGHYYLRARYYAPNIARFTQEDTYRGDGLNLYGYVSNNPVRYVDPSGYCKDGVEGTSEINHTDSSNIEKSMKNLGFNIITNTFTSKKVIDSIGEADEIYMELKGVSSGATKFVKYGGNVLRILSISMDFNSLRTETSPFKQLMTVESIASNAGGPFGIAISFASTLEKEFYDNSSKETQMILDFVVEFTHNNNMEPLGYQIWK